MNLMTFVRLLVLLVIGWTVLAVGAGMLGVGAHESSGSMYFLPRPSLQDALPLGRITHSIDAEYRLVDQTNGQTKPVTLPTHDTWSLLSVSPWRDRDGNIEAVGRWVRRREGEGEFCGLGCVTLADSTVKERVTLDVLPVGKPCWVYGRPGEVLFPAGDGQIYRCNIADRAREDATDDSRRDPGKNHDTVAKAHPLAWATEKPTRRVSFLADPAVSSEPLLRHIVFVALTMQDYRRGQRVNLPSKLWWLLLDDEGDAIVNAGRLTVPGPDDPSDDATYERFPSVVIGARGNISLVYLTRNANERIWTLRWGRLEHDSETALPRMRRVPGSNVLANDLAPSPLVLSTSGEHVYALDDSGQIVKHSIPR
jgi:hypothetical protein